MNNKSTMKEIYDYISQKLNTNNEEYIYIMIYLCYAEYLCNKKEKLFNGIEKVIEKINKPNKQKILTIREAQNITYGIQNKNNLNENITTTINDTIERYINLPFKNLKKLIHEFPAPIDKITKRENSTIDKIISNYHYYETNGGYYFNTPNPKPSKELLEALEEGEEIIKEIKAGKRQGYSTVNEMMKAIIEDD